MSDDRLCEDCPDHEACMTGYPCRVVKAVDKGEPIPPEPEPGPSIIAVILAAAGAAPKRGRR